MRPGCNMCRSGFTCARCLTAPIPGQLTLAEVEDAGDETLLDYDYRMALVPDE